MGELKDYNFWLNFFIGRIKNLSSYKEYLFNFIKTTVHYVIKTASGAIASFSDGVDMPIISLKAQIEPVQDLHGYDNPWPAGGGKNKFGFEEYLIANETPYTKNGNTYTVTIQAGTTLFTNPWVFSDTDVLVTFSCASITAGTATNPRINLLNTNGFTVATISETTLSDAGSGCKVRLNWSTGGTLTIVEPMIEPGSTKTAFAPYSNICPISGHTGVTVEHTGKNLLKLDESEMVATGWNRRFPISLKAGTYIISCQNQIGGSTKGCYVSLTDEGDATIVKELNRGYTFGDTSFVGIAATITEEEAARIRNIRFALRASGTTYEQIANGDIQLELGSTATAYEPYHGNTYDITLPTEAGTVYGGSLTIAEDGSGVLMVDRAMVDLGTLNWTYIGKFYAPIQGAKIPATQQTVPNVLCSIYSADSYYRLVNAISDKAITIDQSGNAYVRDSSYSNATTFKAAMSGVQLLYELAEPIEYTLTPQEVRTFLGQNNIWNDVGNTEVTYLSKEE